MSSKRKREKLQSDARCAILISGLFFGADDLFGVFLGSGSVDPILNSDVGRPDGGYLDPIFVFESDPDFGRRSAFDFGRNDESLSNFDSMTL